MMMMSIIPHRDKDIFTSKTNVLKFLKNKIKLSKIEKIFDFTVHDWEINKNKILKKLSVNFPNEKIIIRSSAIGEDSIGKSEAGNYESILNIDSSYQKQIISGINSVINSYRKKNNFNKKNQILIQTQTENIVTSGVIFTRTPEQGSPYYVINFEDGTSTTGVTHGSINQTIKISRSINKKNVERKWKNLILSVKELESIIFSDSLDIEFGISKDNSITIFQVRPITSINLTQNKQLDLDIKKLISKNQNRFSKSNNENTLLRNSMILSDMADWNPAEIIGNNPKLLDYSLYDFLIMKKSWYEGRKKIHYQRFNPHSLMYKIGNKPYVNVLISFNSLIPEIIPQKLKKRLLKFYLKKILKNPEFHDKVEFEILFSSYDLQLKDRLNELKSNGFSKNEIEIIFKNLLLFTKSTISNFSESEKYCNDSVLKLGENRINLKKSIKKSDNYIKKLKIAENLLNDCKKLGTEPFALMARIAFIGTGLLKSFVSKKLLSQSDFDSFMNSLNSPLSDFQNDLNDLYEKKISKTMFLKKYGHLRPGTYDITIPRYDKENLFLKDMQFRNIKTTKNFSINKSTQNKIVSSIDLEISFNDLFYFIKSSLEMREQIKFEFTKNLSDALELIAESGENLGFTRDDMSYLDVKTILTSFSQYKKSDLKQYWKNKIYLNKNKFILSSHLNLPSIISSKNDFEIIKYYLAKPNFITKKSIKSETKNLDIIKKSSSLKNKLILLEHADPGFDWIFTHNPTGLITKYGGVASHMSIRCSELGLPAAIGCGEVLYNTISNASKILLDCKNEQIIMLENKTSEKFSEEKKVLKSLGYIK